jgi:hypothetical protein
MRKTQYVVRDLAILHRGAPHNRHHVQMTLQSYDQGCKMAFFHTKKFG